MYNGRHYALPYMACTRLLFYRKDIFSNEEIMDDLERKIYDTAESAEELVQFNALANILRKI